MEGNELNVKVLETVRIGSSHECGVAVIMILTLFLD